MAAAEGRLGRMRLTAGLVRRSDQFITPFASSRGTPSSSAV
jgi:hypothetical protein